MISTAFSPRAPGLCRRSARDPQRPQAQPLDLVYLPAGCGAGDEQHIAFYAISGLDEARAYLNEPTLRAHLLEISGALLALEESDPTAVFGFPDDLKLRSSMTLFAAAAPDEPVFSAVLDKFFGGQPDARTLQILGL